MSIPRFGQSCTRLDPSWKPRSRKYCDTDRHSPRSAGSPQSRLSWAGRSSRPMRSSRRGCCPPTATSANSPTRTGSTFTAAAITTWLSGMASISASASCWPGWRQGPRRACCWAATPKYAWPTRHRWSFIAGVSLPPARSRYPCGRPEKRQGDLVVPAPYFLCIHGELVIVGYEPDGDSVRFIADDASHYGALKRADRIRPSQRDGSVQLRFEGVDAPELHYGVDAQPLGATARDALLDWIGFTAIEYDQHRKTQVRSATPTSVRAAIFAQMVEVNGRPVSYVLVETT